MRRTLMILCATALLFCARNAPAQSFLFDATKAEMAANADWVVDADLHNLGTDPTTHQMVLGIGTESNPQQNPTPPASGITAGTSETYWQGALSAWGVSLVKTGKSVQSLPYNGAITYGNGSNPQDLSNYKVFVIDEPNIKFTATEKTALYSFIKAGGSLFAISDHTGSDRNNDGFDSVKVWNDFLSADGTKANPLGFLFNADDISPDSFTVDTTASDPVTHGPSGTVTEFVFSSGASITIDPTANASIKAAVWSTTTKTNANAIVAYGTYGLGRFVAIGDSSPLDDGTGGPGDTLFNGWDSGSDSKLVLNASAFLAPEPSSLLLVTAGIGIMMLRRPRK